jgi:hypothetical protein
MTTKLRCPRCNGNLYFNRDADDPAWTCLQCSRSYRPARTPAHPARVTRAA